MSETLPDRLAGPSSYMLGDLTVEVVPSGGVAYPLEPGTGGNKILGYVTPGGWVEPGMLPADARHLPPADIVAAGPSFSCCAGCASAPATQRCSGCPRSTATSKLIERIRKCQE